MKFALLAAALLVMSGCSIIQVDVHVFPDAGQRRTTQRQEKNWYEL